MGFRLWPRRLGTQLILVTAAAVVISNIVVAAWFEMGRERLNESSFTERVLDRTVSAAVLLSAVPQDLRPRALHAMASRVWRFELQHGNNSTPPRMSAREEAIAARVRAMLPSDSVHDNVSVKFGEQIRRHGRVPEMRSAMVITIPVDPQTRLVTTVLRPPRPPWPAETLLAALAAIVTASAAAAFIARRVSRPLSRLSSAAIAAAQGKDAPRVPEEGPEDVRQAAAAFNAMTDQVSRTLVSQRQLLSAVGHDLRTPITAMRINIEFVEDEELRERLERNLEELQDLTEAVLSAAKGAGGETPRSIDLTALVESVCADLDDLGEPVVWHLHDPAPVSCRPNEIRRAVRNLIENAVAYGKRAEVSIAANADGYDVIVEDDGPGIAEADRDRVFEPFVRLESSRSMETGGSGLGLTLVRAIVEGHGGTITLENRDREAGGLRARLHLPRNRESA
ncbi:MAG: HAMP domain-containing protein [Alphaproteobacteria bacterium]|nr:HAMP domain-containing protein [Alphaproteobacteria bacterium]